MAVPGTWQKVNPKGQKILVARAKHNLRILEWDSRLFAAREDDNSVSDMALPSANQKIACLNFPGQVRLRLLLQSLAQFAAQMFAKGDLALIRVWDKSTARLPQTLDGFCFGTRKLKPNGPFVIRP